MSKEDRPPPLVVFRCPVCAAEIQTVAEATVGHRCPDDNHRWHYFKRPNRHSDESGNH
jgi:hypothetical protein